jgi:hypothetical protein
LTFVVQTGRFVRKRFPTGHVAIKNHPGGSHICWNVVKIGASVDTYSLSETRDYAGLPELLAILPFVEPTCALRFVRLCFLANDELPKVELPKAVGLPGNSTWQLAEYCTIQPDVLPEGSKVSGSPFSQQDRQTKRIQILTC